MEIILGPRIKSLRHQKLLSLKQFAKRLDVDQAHISRIESGKVYPSEALLKRISRVVRGDYEELSILAGRFPDDVRRIFLSQPSAACALVRGAFQNRDQNPPLGTGVEAPRKYRVIDLFSGAGGFTRGFVDSGRFQSVFANDFNDWAAKTFNFNFGDHCLVGDLNEVLRNRDFEFPSADIVIGGPPCQGFSLLNKNRVTDPRKNLTLAYLEVVRRVKPLAFVMENVPEMLGSAEYRSFEGQAERMGYRLVADILNAADYGVPQRRKRAIVVAVRAGLPSLPIPTHIDPKKRDASSHRLDWKSVKEAIGDLPRPKGVEIRYNAAAPLDLHFGRNPTAQSRLRYRCVPEGGNRLDLLRERPDLTPPCWIKKRSGGTDLFGRLWRKRPAFTIRTEFFKPEKGRYLHPTQHRPITHREAARFQSFPDNFKFLGTKTQIAMQIGNAVPPLLGQRIAEALVRCLDSVAQKPQG